MLKMSWIAEILQLYSQVADLFGNVIVKRINIRLFGLLARFHYILNLPRMCSHMSHFKEKKERVIKRNLFGVLRRNELPRLKLGSYLFWENCMSVILH